MVGYLRALATDFDGTLTTGGTRPQPSTLDALARFRDAGGVVLLTTGRIISELREVFPDVDDHVDVIIGENGCVVESAVGHRLLAAPVEIELTTALRRRGVRFRGGEVILAGSARDRIEVLEEVRHLELDCQLVFNRSELMILPAGVTKGTGLFDVLGDIGISRHSAIGVGDAENDHSLLDTCEVGVAVANSVSSLKSFADVVLKQPAGAGVAYLCDLMIRSEIPPMHSSRWQVQLGTTSAGASVSLPSSQINVLICGETGVGKSYVAGLFAERLIAQGYSVLVVDPEGDHLHLGRLRGVVLIDGAGGLPQPERVAAMFSQRFASIVLDLSLVPKSSHHAYLARLATAIDESRREHGLPHWIIADEAQDSATDISPDSALLSGGATSGSWGFCFATYRPDRLRSSVLDQLDAVVALGTGFAPTASIAAACAAIGDLSPTRIGDELANVQRGSALLLERANPERRVRFQVGSRVTAHRRHWHKYTDASLPADKQFYFRNGHDQIFASAGNVRQLRDTLHDCPDSVIVHHVQSHDLSRWIRSVLANPALAAQISNVEGQLTAGQITVDSARNTMLDYLRGAYRV